MEADCRKLSTALIFKYLPFCILLVLQPCLKAQNVKMSLQKGIIIDTVLCSGNSAGSYSLFLPENYRESIGWPVLFIFDPGARGKFALEKFVPAAKKFGYILAASNNVRNGNFSKMLDDAESMYDDVIKRFNIDRKRIFTAGFSGGSRLAAGFSMNNKEISGVIGCGAGMPNSDFYGPARMSHLIYFGIVGNKDMNYIEMTDLSHLLTDSGILSYFLVFNGGHEWPSQKNLEFAVGWLELQLMNKGIIPERKDFINDFSLQMMLPARQSEADSDIVSSEKYYSYAARDLRNSTFLPDILSSLKKMEKSDSYKKSLKESEKNYRKELLKREDYQKAFADIVSNQELTDSIFNWWKIEIHSLNSKIRGKRNSDSLMACRLLNMLTIASIEYGNNLMSARNYRSAAGFFNVWTICEPDSKNSWYNLARAYSLDEQNDKAVNALDKSVRNGFKSKEAIYKDPAFKLILNDKRFTKLMTGIK
jgi:tetratricopeptide (TPR) repeat protein